MERIFQHCHLERKVRAEFGLPDRFAVEVFGTELCVVYFNEEGAEEEVLCRELVEGKEKEELLVDEIQRAVKEFCQGRSKR